MKLLPAYVSPDLEADGSASHGRCLVARRPIAAGDLLVVWGGRVRSLEELLRLPREYAPHALQIDDDRFLVSEPPWPDADRVNHSCDPNGVLRDARALEARRPIARGEEITFDYATSDSTPYDEFPCRCGAALCRGRVSAEDWRRGELWRRYGGRYSPYLRRRVLAESAGLGTKRNRIAGSR